MADCGVSIVLIWAPESRLALNASPLDQSLTSQRASWKAAFEAQSVASFRVQACGYVDSRKALRVGEYSDVCRGGLEQQFLKRADAKVENCVTNTAQDRKKMGRFSPPLFGVPSTAKNYCCCSSRSTRSPRCTSSSANTIMPVAVVGVVPITTISPTARRG